MMLIQKSDENKISCNGINGFVKRKDGEVIPILSTEEMFKTNSKTLKDPQKKQKQIPKIEEGDTIISGKDTLIHLSLGGSLKKEAGINDDATEKSFYLLENTEVKLTGVKHFEKEDKKKNTKYIIDSVNGIEFLKGSIMIMSLGDNSIMDAPFATIKFYGKGVAGFCDITPNGLYTFPQLGPGSRVEYLCKKTKKSYITKEYKPNTPVFPTEIVITNDGIYKVPFTEADNPNLSNILNISLKTMKPGYEMLKDTLPQQQNMMEGLASGDLQAQLFSGLDVVKNMTPEDLERLVEKCGTKVTKEQMEIIKNAPKMLKDMENSGQMSEMKKGYAKAGNMFAGMDKESITLFSKQQERAMDEFDIKSNKMLEDFKKAKKEPYKPIKSEYKVA